MSCQETIVLQIGKWKLENWGRGGLELRHDCASPHDWGVDRNTACIYCEERPPSSMEAMYYLARIFRRKLEREAGLP